MLPIIRLYNSEATARQAASGLENEGFLDVALFVPSEDASQNDRVIRDAVADELVPGGYARVCIDGMARGRSIVSVCPPFGRGGFATETLDRFEPVDSELLTPYEPSNPSPFSDALGLPVLSDPAPSAELVVSEYALGEPSLSRKAAPFSSMFGLKTLTKSKRTKSSAGQSRNPAPFSSLFGLKTLTTPNRAKNSSFGFPLLSRNPAPLSSLFGLRTLSKKDQRRKRR